MPLSPGMNCDHAAFSPRFAGLASRAAADDWRDLDGEWARLFADFDTHMTLQEDGRSGQVAKQLRAEHDAIRQLVRVIGVEIRLRAIHTTSFDLLAHVMAEHAALWRPSADSAASPARAGRGPGDTSRRE